MIKLFSLKQQSKDGLNPQSSKKTSAAYLRIQKGTCTHMVCSISRVHNVTMCKSVTHRVSGHVHACVYVWNVQHH